MGVWRRLAVVLLLGGTGAIFGAAASVTFSADTLGATRASIPRCTTAGLTVFQNLAAGTVVSVTVSSLPAACGNVTLQLTVNNGIVSASGSATVPAAGGSATVTLGTAPAATTAEQTDLVLVGP